jgi:hypothetical protein
MAYLIAKILKFIGVCLDRRDVDQQARGMKPSSLRLFAVLIACTFALHARATFLPGTVPVAPGQTVVPGLVTQGQPPGTFLASQIIPEPSFTLTSAVFLNPTGTLDFYYQLMNGANGSTISSLLTQSFDSPDCRWLSVRYCFPLRSRGGDSDARQSDQRWYRHNTQLQSGSRFYR